jgi:hypothetical protein
MAFTKHASLESAQILDVKGTRERSKTASLDKLSDFSDFRTQDGYMYARIRAISSRVNKNNDGWPSVELAGSPDVFDQHTSSEGFTVEASKEKKYGFSTFVGKPIFVDHNNTDPSRARGVIVDAKFHVDDSHTASLDPYYSSDNVDREHLPAAWVELLLEIDAERFPRLAQAIKEGSENPDKGIDGFSMGCDVERTICNICSNEATAPDEFCDHIRMKGATFDYKDSSTGTKTSKKSYENCYGIKFFEISAVFDPADETALLRELVHKEGSVKQGSYLQHKRAIVEGELEEGQLDHPDPLNRDEAVMQLAQQYIEQGIESNLAFDRALREVNRGLPGAGDGEVFQPKMKDYDLSTMDKFGPPVDPGAVAPEDMPPGFAADAEEELNKRWGPNRPKKNDPRWSHTKEADNPPPQSELTKAPEDVDTLREEKICPVCGSDMDSEKCEVCGHIEPPEGLNTPDLTKADSFDQVEEATNPEGGQSFLDARKNGEPERLSSAMWEPKFAGRINVQERPIKSDPTPVSDEPKESIIKDEAKPVTSSTRTAADLVAVAGQTQQENSMSDHRTADATPADPSGKPDKRVDVTGVGGVIDANNEAASKPEGAHSWEPKGTTVDVTGKGGILEDSNAEAAKPSVGTQDVEKVVKTQDSGPTKTFDNSNEPNSAVTDRAVQSHAEREAAKSGVKPNGGADVQPQRREDVETVVETKPQSGTDQWTGTGGNGVTRQADPVTKKVDPNIDVKKSQVTSHIVNAFKLADTEVELGMLDASAKYARVAELEGEEPAVVEAQLQTLARVRTAGLAKQPTVTRLPSLKQASRDESQEKTASFDDGVHEPLW